LKRVLLFARDPGGANSVAVLAKRLRNKFQLKLYAADFARKIFESNDIDHIPADVPEDILQQMTDYDMILTGTSSNNSIEHALWTEATKIRIPSVAYLDHWMGYERFYDPLLEEYLLPDATIVTDEIAVDVFRRKFQHLNHSVHGLGNPHLETLCENMISLAEKFQYKRLWNLSEFDQVVIYAAEKIAQTSMEDLYGFNEYDQFLKLWETLAATGRKIKLFFLAHPKHSLPEVREQLNKMTEIQNSKVEMELNEKYNKEILVQIADQIFGINTMVLVEGMLYEIPVCSIQVDVKGISDFEFIRQNYIYNADSRQRLQAFVNREVACVRYDKNKIIGSVDRISRFIDGLIPHEA
jgi:hypothetical protein